MPDYNTILKLLDIGISIAIIVIFIKWITILYGDIKKANKRFETINKDNNEVLDRVHRSLDMLTNAMISSNPNIHKGNQDDRSD